MKRSRIRIGMMALTVSTLVTGLVTVGCGSSKETAGKDQQKRGNITVSVYDRGNIPKDVGTPDKNLWTDWINKNGPVNVKYIPIPRGESTQKFNTLLASGNAPDLILDYNKPWFSELYNQKELMPLDDLIEKNSTVYKKLLSDYPELRKLSMMPDGKIYMLGRVTGLRVNVGILIRADWLKKLHLEVPKTMDDFYKVAKAFADQDPNGNGKKDTFGFNLPFDGRGSIDYMFQNVEWVVENGQLVHKWDRTKSALAFKKQLYDDKIIDRDFLNDKNGQKAQQDFANGKLGIWDVGLLIPSTLKAYEVLKQNNPSAEVIAIPFPVSPYGQFSPEPNTPYQVIGGINAAAKDPVSVMKYVDFMASESTSFTLSYGLEGVHYKKGPDGAPVPIDNAKNSKELPWNVDLQMLTSTIYNAKYSPFDSWINLNDPTDKSYTNIIKMAEEYYLDPKRPIPQFTPAAFMPTMPADLQVISTNLEKTINDIYVKAIVSGSSYTVDQAIQDAQAAWNKGGGQKIDEWYTKWYSDNKDKAYLTADFYKAKKYSDYAK